MAEISPSAVFQASTTVLPCVELSATQRAIGGGLRARQPSPQPRDRTRCVHRREDPTMAFSLLCSCSSVSSATSSTALSTTQRVAIASGVSSSSRTPFSNGRFCVRPGIHEQPNGGRATLLSNATQSKKALHRRGSRKSPHNKRGHK